MKMYYWKEPTGNFGDDLNPWIWPKIFPGAFDDDDSVLFIGIGTLLQKNLPRSPLKIIFGAGAWQGRGEPVIDSTCHIYFVRGPLTCKLLGLSDNLSLTDPALLVCDFVKCETTKRYPIAYMPHHWSANLGNWQKVASEVGIHYIDPSGDIDNVIIDINQSELLLTEALHGAVVADALRVPWIPIKAYGHILDFKWHDWCASIGMQYDPEVFPSLWKSPESRGVLRSLKTRTKEWLIESRIRFVLKHGRPQISSNDNWKRNYQNIHHQVELFKRNLRVLKYR